MTDLPFGEPLTEANPAAPAPRKCRRHVWTFDPVADVNRCLRCGRTHDHERSSRGRRNRSRGNAIEREVAAALGMRRVGQYGGPDDARGELFAAQVKSGVAYPERLDRWLRAVPVTAGQVRILVVADAPGPGHRRRALVVLDLADWQALHGETVA